MSAAVVVSPPADVDALPCTAVPAQAAAPDDASRLAEGFALLGRGELRAAAEAFREALGPALAGQAGTGQAPSQRQAGLLGLSLVARQSGELVAALRLAQAALEADALAPAAWANYGAQLQANGLTAEAQAAFLRALALPAEDRGAYLPALIGLGELLTVTGRMEPAIECFREALGIRSGLVAALYGLGNALALGERFTEALEAFEAGLAGLAGLAESAKSAGLAGLAELHFAVGFCRARLGRHSSAAESYHRAVTLRRGFAGAWGNLAVCLVADGRDYLAAPCFEQALLANPKLVSALVNYGNLLRSRKQFAEARSCYERALEIDARNGEVLVACAYLHLEESRDEARFEAAEAFLERAAGGVANPEVENARGIVALARHTASGEGRWLEQALDAFGRAEALGHKTAASNAGNTLLRAGRVSEAIQAHGRAVELDPIHAGARYNLGLSQLRAGDFRNGWRNYEARWEFREVHARPRRFQQPRWTGQALAEGKNRLFVYAEQGLGDTLQFIRYLPLLRGLGARLVVEVQRPLARLLQPVVEAVGGQILAAGETIPAFDWHVPLLSLPFHMGTTLETVPSPLCLKVLPGLAAGSATAVRTELASIGLCWAGNPKYAADHERSTALDTFLPLLWEFSEFRWVSLQKGEASGQIAEVMARSGGGFSLVDAASGDCDLADTAATVAALDLVITTDTVIAHLAGSMGKRCWLLLPWQSDWRWMQTTLTTPWYPTMRLFRQPAAMAWTALMEEVSEALTGEKFRSCGVD